jgi:hypothetical protein
MKWRCSQALPGNTIPRMCGVRNRFLGEEEGAGKAGGSLKYRMQRLMIGPIANPRRDRCSGLFDPMGLSPANCCGTHGFRGRLLKANPFHQSSWASVTCS